MDYKRSKYVKNRDIITQGEVKKKVLLLDNLTDEDKENLEKVKELLLPIIKKYQFIKSIDDLFKIIEVQGINIPIDIFVKELTILEAIFKYLKEEKNFSLTNIANLLKRDERNIWHAYNSTKKKYPDHLKFEISKILVPVSIFENKKLSVFEILVSYLKSNLSLKFSEIASLLNRDARTIWTVWSRARRKNEK